MGIRYYFFLLFLSLASCKEQECPAVDPVFSNNQPESAVYREALSHLLRVSQSVSYYLDSWVEEGGVIYMNIAVRSKSGCAQMILEVKESQGLEGIRRTKGAGYSGARLAGLKYDIVPDSKGPRFIYRSLEHIAD